MLSYLQLATAATAALLSVFIVVLRLRVGWLRDMGRAPRLPRTPGPFFLEAIWSFVLSGQYREIGDGRTTFLVLGTRGLGLLTATLAISMFALISADENSSTGPPQPRPSLATPAPNGPHEEDDAFKRNALVLDALSSGDIQSIAAHTAVGRRTAQEVDLLRSAAKVIPTEKWTSSAMRDHSRTFPDGIVVVDMSVEYYYPSAKNVILDTTFRYSSSVPELTQINLRPAS
jgi:hypothetical protein